MTLVLVSGLSGSGKSTVHRRLVELGHGAWGFDEDDFGEWIDTNGEPVRFPTVRHDADGTSELSFVVHRDRIENLARSSAGRTGFLCGGAGHEFAFWELLDRVIYLTADDDTLRKRLATRTDSGYGKTQRERDGILGANQTMAAGYRAYGAIVVDGTRPIDDVIADVIRASNEIG